MIGLVSLWPGDIEIERPGVLAQAQLYGAAVVAIAETECRFPQATGCRRVEVRLKDGPDAGETTSFILGDQGNAEVRLSVGDDIRVFRNQLPEEAQLGESRSTPTSWRTSSAAARCCGWGSPSPSWSP